MNSRTATARDLMLRFAERTDIGAPDGGRRYLWTDAFAVCNFLELGLDELAQRLVDSVHRGLGHFQGSAQWLSGLSDVEAAIHPTVAGLRIGKPLPERAADEPFDPELEWERDGQYFHYLTKWALALNRMTERMRAPTWHFWARELLDVAHRAFTRGNGAQRRIVWKMSVGLTRPLVSSVGQHDAFDGYVTCRELDATARAERLLAAPNLDSATADFEKLTDETSLRTNDPLGIGGLLMDAARLARVDRTSPFVEAALSAALDGLLHFATTKDANASAEHRLAFRELGLCIGLDAARALSPELERYWPLREKLESFWVTPAHREGGLWQSHADINDVMLATSLGVDRS